MGAAETAISTGNRVLENATACGLASGGLPVSLTRGTPSKARPTGTALLAPLFAGNRQNSPASAMAEPISKMLPAITRKIFPAWLASAACCVTAFSETITFDAAHTEGPKRGRVGFLNSIKANVLPPEWITEIAPSLWRGGGGWTADGAFEIYDYFTKEVGVPRVILELGLNKKENRNLTPAEAAERMMLEAKKRGQHFDSIEIKNEPNLWSPSDPAPSKPDIASPPVSLENFMTHTWIPAFRAIKKVDPSANVFGPSISMVSKVLPNCREKLFAFIDAAIASQTLPEYINWHFQDGYRIAESHTQLAHEIRAYVAAKGAAIKGIAAGETIRPGDERNTSPSVAIDVFAASECADMDQIHAAWSSTPVYGQRTSPEPVLGGLLTKDHSGRRGVWWTYQFYAKSTGDRLKCREGMSGGAHLVGLAFADASARRIRVLVGSRDGSPDQPGSLIQIDHIPQAAPYILKDGKTRVRILSNPQTETAVDQLACVLDAVLPLVEGTLKIPGDIPKWGALLVELSSP